MNANSAPPSSRSVSRSKSPTVAARPVVIGACNLDTVLQLSSDDVKVICLQYTDQAALVMLPGYHVMFCYSQFNGGTNLASSHAVCGGVGRNLCDGLTRFGDSPAFLSALGDDLNGRHLMAECPHMVRTLETARTAKYCVKRTV